MNERINWIDWAKALTVCGIVFIHVPQSQEWFYFRFLQACVLTVFLWVSGYLKKDYGSDKANWRKYWHSLILPYLLYNAIVYPYWLVRYYLLNGGMPDLLHALRPVFGALLLEHENAFCEPLNGPLWYLPAILLMHITIDLCRKTRHQHVIMIALCCLAMVLYAANKKWYFAPDLTPMGFLRGLPFYYLGYVMGTKGTVPNVPIPTAFVLLALSLLFFHWHLQLYYAGEHWLHIVLFYPVNLCFLFSVIYACKLLDGIRLKVVTDLSIGTLVIIGLFYPLITIVNFALEHLLPIDGGICYHWYEAIPVTLLIVALLYPAIRFAQRHAPMLIGRKKS